jgi:hypothetical protein
LLGRLATTVTLVLPFVVVVVVAGVVVDDDRILEGSFVCVGGVGRSVYGTLLSLLLL